MDDIFLRYIPLPTNIKGVTIEDESGNYNVYLNTQLTYEASVETLQHEIKHITNNDFHSFLHVKDIEK